MEKKILTLIMTIFALVVITLPMIPTVQALKGGTPREIYHDLAVVGKIFPDYDPVPEMQGNMKYAEYTAYCAPVFILWDYDGTVFQQMLMGPATYEISYKINPNTMKGVVHLKTEVNVPGGKFVGDMIWVGELEVWKDAQGNQPYPNAVQPKTVKWHTFWKGTDTYDGWTIVQNFNRHPPWVSGPNMPGDNHLIKPIDE
jgi:hypothetical protein